MKKVRLTEKDLQRIVKRTIKENIPRGVYDPESDFEYDQETIDIFHDITRYFNERTEDINFDQYKELSKKLGRWFLGGV